ncbi:LysR family transcriptional regulator [Saccharibacillus qingshengii]|uniref:LysR family transcriptional regulator n=1 Tax=Saccharibacillus qingshengii TaxID=1763540 RepID=UPI001553D7FB|nr:LysR family transcriptional regulator [Saccharibacillus qingshengii]
MELLQLKYFQTVAYTEHISKAAKQLNIAQPSLSLTIKRLENELGTALFERTGRNIQLSSSGHILLKHVNRIFTEIDNARLEIHSEEQSTAGIIKISITNPRFLTGLIRSYVTSFPESKIIQSLGAKNEIAASLKKGSIDLGITGHPIQDEEIESRVLVNEDIVLVLPSNHKLTDQTKVPLSQVADESFITLANNAEYSDFTALLYEKAGFSPNIAFEVDSHLLVEIAKLDQGAALLPISICRTLGLNYVQLTDEAATYPVGLSWLRHKTLSSSASKFRDFIISYYQENHELFLA